MIAAALLGYGLEAVALGYVGLANWRLRRFDQATPARRDFAPAVSVLKPLCGLEPDLYENLRSYFRLDYSRLQIVFGVQDPLDPALQVVERLKAEFPHIEVAIVVNRCRHGSNPKLSNVINMLAAARHDILVLSDSDIRVPPDYLARVVAPLADPGVGAVTCAYTAHPATSNVAAQMASLQINDWFLPSVLVAGALVKVDFCMGSTIALRCDALAAIGGFGVLRDMLADDYEIGHRMVERGYRVMLSDCVVETVACEIDLKQLFLHELRWARTIRTVRPFGFVGVCVTHTVAMSLLAALALSGAGIIVPVAMVAVGILARLILHFHVAARFAGPRGTSWLLPLRDALSLGVWVASFVGRRVNWRGQCFSVRHDGSLVAINSMGPP
jgi:ceramide glucosyltransferase